MISSDNVDHGEIITTAAAATVLFGVTVLMYPPLGATAHYHRALSVASITTLRGFGLFTT